MAQQSSIVKSSKPARVVTVKDPQVVKQQFADVLKVFKDIERVANVGHDVHLMITQGGSVAATNCKDMIVMSDQKIIEFLRRDIDYMALVIAHEFAHILDQSCRGTPAVQRRNEKSADLHGQKLANKAGYNGCDGYQMWIDYYNMYGPNPNDHDHPGILQRAAYMKCGTKFDLGITEYDNN